MRSRGAASAPPLPRGGRGRPHRPALRDGGTPGKTGCRGWAATPLYLGRARRTQCALSPTTTSSRLLAGQVQSRESVSLDWVLAYYLCLCAVGMPKPRRRWGLRRLSIFFFFFCWAIRVTYDLDLDLYNEVWVKRPWLAKSSLSQHLTPVQVLIRLLTDYTWPLLPSVPVLTPRLHF